MSWTQGAISTVYIISTFRERSLKSAEEWSGWLHAAGSIRTKPAVCSARYWRNSRSKRYAESPIWRFFYESRQSRCGIERGIWHIPVHQWRDLFCPRRLRNTPQATPKPKWSNITLNRAYLLIITNDFFIRAHLYFAASKLGQSKTTRKGPDGGSKISVPLLNRTLGCAWFPACDMQ